MSDKKHGLTHSQTLGIIWLSVGLLLIVAIAVFYPKSNHKDNENDSLVKAETVFLTQKEDSVYSARRKKHYTSKKDYTRNKEQAPVAFSNSSQSPATTPVTKQPLSVELNSADTLTLQLLHGIGPVFARRIVRYRERLGGYADRQQLLEVYGFTPQLLEHISPYLTLDTTLVEQININTASLKELARHPYMEYYVARDIVALRNKGICFTSADDLRTVPSMADSSLARLLPYLAF